MEKKYSDIKVKWKKNVRNQWEMHERREEKKLKHAMDRRSVLMTNHWKTKKKERKKIPKCYVIYEAWNEWKKQIGAVNSQCLACYNSWCNEHLKETHWQNSAYNF